MDDAKEEVEEEKPVPPQRCEPEDVCLGLGVEVAFASQGSGLGFRVGSMTFHHFYLNSLAQAPRIMLHTRSCSRQSTLDPNTVNPCPDTLEFNPQP